MILEGREVKNYKTKYWEIERGFNLIYESVGVKGESPRREHRRKTHEKGEKRRKAALF